MRFTPRPTLSSCQRRFALHAKAAESATSMVSIQVGFIAVGFSGRECQGADSR